VSNERAGCLWASFSGIDPAPPFVRPAGRYTEIESCLVFLIAYTSYFFSNALTMSGQLEAVPLP
jgi:hypothetical protein